MTVRHTIVILFIFAAIFGIAYTLRPTSSLCSNLDCITLANKHKFIRKETYSETEQSYRALFSSGSRRLRIETNRMNSESAESELTAAVTRVKALFEKAPAPYPGEISDAIICDPDYIPSFTDTTVDATRIRYFTGYLNNRMTFGSCSKDQAVYKGIVAFLYCKKASLLIKLELFQPVREFEEQAKEIETQLLSLTCSK